MSDWFDNQPETWDEWREWAQRLVETHRPDQVADSLADLGEQVTRFRKALQLISDSALEGIAVEVLPPILAREALDPKSAR